MESNRSYSAKQLEIEEVEKSKKVGSLQHNESKKIKSSKRKMIIFESYGFYLTLLLLILNALGFVFICFTDYYDNAIIQQVTIKENGTFYKLWLNPKVGVIVRVYPFNYTNMEAIISGKEIPKVQEVGPYAFREDSIKTNVEFSGVENITYSFNRSLTFLHESSRGTLNDTIITPNVVYISAFDKVNKDSIKKIGLNLIMPLFQSKPFVQVSAYDFVMGYDDNFSAMLRGTSTLLRKEAHPPFGILAKRTGFNADRLTIGTGVPDLNDFGLIKKYNDKEKLNIWNSSECNNITASDGQLFPQNLAAKSDIIYVYAKDLCRRLPLKFQKEFINKDGFTVRRFLISSDVYSSPNINPENSCFCLNSCPLSGVQDISPCSYDAPFVISHPHFMYGDKDIFNKIEGLKPNPEKHTYYVDLHKNLGIPLKGNSRIQLGIVVNKDTLTGYKSLKNETILPIAWMDFEIPELPDNLNSLLYHVTFTMPLIKSVLKWGFLVLFLLSVVKLVFYMNKLFNK
ncbi:hypothetical protein O3M35_008431 [Rhynocoris fuscipes]|uniref:Scavenger receptor class B member 1 n=1 Tax=Rhynocoris fuscipes TaxID=488301 RepID=A0AAW1D7Q6_9HEMI